MQTMTRLSYNYQTSSTVFYAFSSPHAVSPHLWSFPYADHASSLIEATCDRIMPSLRHLPGCGESELLLHNCSCISGQETMPDALLGLGLGLETFLCV